MSTAMSLPVQPPVKPMLAKAVKGVPRADSVAGGLLYEPKWDGFRCLLFRDGDDVVLGSRNEKPLTRYFPELVAAAQQLLPPRIVLDGEIVIAGADGLQFERLLDRIHPADSRVQLLARETPASYVAFDLLAFDDESLLDTAFAQRRARLEEVLAAVPAPFFVTPATDDEDLAEQWFDLFEGAGLDGVVAKPLADTYHPDQRALMKVKHERTADVVVAGFRWHKSGDVVGSLLLGLYDDAGFLQHVGVAASFPMAKRRELVDLLAAYRVDDLAGHPWEAWAEDSSDAERRPGATSRWNAGKDLSWVPLRPDLVAEVAYDHLQGTRFRHTTQFRRWRDDRDPRSCTYEQLEHPVAFDLGQVLAPHS
jgi:ATP-dependent DNA ligase